MLLERVAYLPGYSRWAAGLPEFGHLFDAGHVKGDAAAASSLVTPFGCRSGGNEAEPGAAALWTGGWLDRVHCWS